MPHDTPLISTIVAGLVLAFILGAIANRLRLPPLVGYLIAGVAVGPYSPGFVADAALANQLAEIGVVLLMFGVGLHFSLKDLVSVQAVAVPGALVRILAATALGMGLGFVLGWPPVAGMIFGLALSVSSTVVLIKTLQDRHQVDSERGRISTGWVIVEDIAMILALVLIPAMADITGAAAAVPDDPFVELAGQLLGFKLGIFGVLAVTGLKLLGFVGFMFIVGRRLIPMLLHYTAHTGSRELFRLAVLAIALGVAVAAAYLFGVSLALGAFFAGMILSESELSHRAAEETLPLRDAFAVLFFVSVGMLFDPSILWREPLPLLATLLIILGARFAIVYATLIAFRRPPAMAIGVAASLAQIGEFSFILATLGLTLEILPHSGQDYIVAGAIVSILLNPLVLWAAERYRPQLEARFGKAEAEPAGGRVQPPFGAGNAAAAEAAATPAPEEEVLHPTALTGHTVLIGYGRVGTVVTDGLREAGKPFLVIEDAEGRIAAAREAGLEVIVGNAAASKPLKLANIEGATTVIVGIPNAFEAGQAVEQCRRANPSAFIIARAHSDEEEGHLLNLGANSVIMGEREIGLAMLDLVQHGRSQMAAKSGLEAVEAAIVPRDAKPVRTLPREPQRMLSDIDEEELARAIGAPVMPPFVAAPTAGGTPMVSETVVDVADDAIAEAVAPEDMPAPEGQTEVAGTASMAAPEREAPRPRQPATAPAEPYDATEAPPPLEEKSGA